MRKPLFFVPFAMFLMAAEDDCGKLSETAPPSSVPPVAVVDAGPTVVQPVANADVPAAETPATSK